MSKKHNSIVPEGGPLLADGWEFDVLEHLGTGGMSELYKVQDRITGHVYALKAARPSLRNMAKILKREARLVGRLKHPGIVKIYQFNFTRPERIPFILMEYIEGVTLFQRMKKLGKFELHEALEIASLLLLTVHHLHMAGIVHRDLKPTNVILQEDPGRVFPRIIDFGIFLPETMEGETSQFVGTAGYASLEQILMSKNIGPKTDVFSIGLMLFEMLTGTRPFEEYSKSYEEMRKTVDLPMPSLALFGDFPKAVVKIVDAMLSQDPEMRPSAAVAAAALRAEWKRVAPENDPRAMSTESIMVAYERRQEPIPDEVVVPMPGSQDAVPIHGDGEVPTGTTAPDPLKAFLATSSNTSSLTVPNKGKPLSPAPPGPSLQPMKAALPSKSRRGWWVVLAAGGIAAALVVVVWFLRLQSTEPAPPTIAPAAIQAPTATSVVLPPASITPPPAFATLPAASATSAAVPSAISPAPSALSPAKPVRAVRAAQPQQSRPHPSPPPPPPPSSLAPHLPYESLIRDQVMEP
ncbi:MAG: protein kinase [Polyangiaceae bacterium]|nr:protein kinase [Polyangiaceae bacterium]